MGHPPSCRAGRDPVGQLDDADQAGRHHRVGRQGPPRRVDVDVVPQAGAAPANFLDAGGGSKADAIVDALEVITSDPKVKAILFNIFGGITRCDEVAKGIIEATGRIGLELPLVVRLDGTNSEEGLALLAGSGLGDLHQEETMLGAAARVVELAEGSG